jgi:penicillin-binding protein-related factor A (putative recombinase)
MKKNDGKETEKIFDDLYKTKPGIVWYQFTDTYKARNVVDAQPADRLLIYQGQAWLIEIKSTIDEKRFPLKNISKKQVGAGRYWQAAGAREYFIIHQKVWNKFYFVPFTIINDFFKEGRSSIFWDEIEMWAEPKDYKFYYY